MEPSSAKDKVLRARIKGRSRKSQTAFNWTFLLALAVVILGTSLVQAEYTWNGTDWVWNEEKVRNNLNVNSNSCPVI